MTSAPRPTVGPVWIVSDDPPVFLTGMPSDDYLGIAPHYAERHGGAAAGFIVFPTWSIERAGVPDEIAQAHAAHVARYPSHRFRFMCNTAREAELLQALGLPAQFLNKNFTVSDTIFRPLPEIEPRFDAIYNARFVRQKRHELAALVPNLAYLTYVEPEPHWLADFAAINRANQLRNPAHVLLNPIEGGAPAEMSKEDVNAALAQARVGLVLSEVEGASYASMEYLLAGLPVVSTPSLGGRDVFFDPETCLVCEPNPGAVRDAVAEMKARNLPRKMVRERALSRIAPERQRFLGLVDEVVAELGGEQRLAGGGWPFGDRSGVTWRPFATHLDDIAGPPRTRLAAELGLDPGLLQGVQLEAPELRPIVEAIRARPGCRLLVFGCGNDSAFWEAVNAEGETAFVEDDPAWANTVAPRLSGSAIHLVAYGTQLSQWRGLLDMPTALRLDLPLALTIQKWDVIVVDGPAGYQPLSTGRMKAIYTASRLVAPGGCVFVHDVEREVEAAYAARYLGADRLVVQARGHALLRGYAF